ncbi:unnamed protein product [Bemisia tabaci]|uniref:Inhibitor of growth protein n=1 Tax=Bemisia tabaci TaxID=7038 RepID=A0A9P0AA31_BEMTA|nr:PREDICTED: inhibitor of growth protein 3 [Bemisia tabaci]CAH0387388.1 unnamed protein product [Bemisia tabaci]
MLYLEDYLEMIEQLPQELWDRFTDMRELDLQVQNSTDSLEKRVKEFFLNARRMKPQDKEAEYQNIRSDYYKTLEDADEKIQLANNMHELVSRYVRRLDQELHKFKMELEADHMGITEILERRAAESEHPSPSCQKENRYSFSSSRLTNSNMQAIANKKRRDSLTTEAPKRQQLSDKTSSDVRLSQNTAMNMLSSGTISPSPPVSYSLAHMGAGGTAIAAAASQAIAATQQMQQGRRTASLKASYEAIHSSGAGSVGSSAVGGTELAISRELAGAAQTAIAAIQDTHKKHKKKSNGMGNMSAFNNQIYNSNAAIPTVVEESIEDSEQSVDAAYDPDEPRYCTCNEVAYGTMVACDNKNCPYEWYHCPCVGITDPPKGKWYCPTCTANMKRRSRKKE